MDGAGSAVGVGSESPCKSSRRGQPPMITYMLLLSSQSTDLLLIKSHLFPQLLIPPPLRLQLNHHLFQQLIILLSNHIRSISVSLRHLLL